MSRTQADQQDVIRIPRAFIVAFFAACVVAVLVAIGCGIGYLVVRFVP